MNTLVIDSQSIKDQSVRQIYEQALTIARMINNEGGRALFVGGFVRDVVLSQIRDSQYLTKDIDIEVYGLSEQKLVSVLERLGPVNKVGASFAVWKVGTIDISLPRRDSKTGDGHRDFEITYDPTMSFREAARRRDFTINSMLYDPLSEELIDEYGGYDDLTQGVLRAVDPVLFPDDPLRVLRAMQLAARFELRMDLDTEVLCQNINLKTLSRERVGDEWRKLLTLSRRPSIGLYLARRLHILSQLHPTLNTICADGLVFDRYSKALDYAAIVQRENQELIDEPYEFILMVFKILFLELPDTLKLESDVFFTELQVSDKTKKNINILGAVWHRFVSLDSTIESLKQLSLDIAPLTISDLCLLGEVFVSMSHNEKEEMMEILRIRKIREESLNMHILHTPMKLFITGDDVINFGVSDGIIIGSILKEVSSAQIRGLFDNREDGLTFLRYMIK